MCTKKKLKKKFEVHGGSYITIQSVHWLLEKIHLQIQDGYWNNLQNKAYEYLLFSPVKYTEHVTIKRINKMRRVNLVLESLADGIFSERTIFMFASPISFLWERKGGDGIRGFVTASEQNKTFLRAQAERSRHAETTNHADRKKLQ